jgi:hypothetical protein
MFRLIVSGQHIAVRLERISNGETKTAGDFEMEAIPRYNLKPAAKGTISVSAHCVSEP